MRSSATSSVSLVTEVTAIAGPLTGPASAATCDPGSTGATIRGKRSVAVTFPLDGQDLLGSSGAITNNAFSDVDVTARARAIGPVGFALLPLTDANPKVWARGPPVLVVRAD